MEQIISANDTRANLFKVISLLALLVQKVQVLTLALPLSLKVEQIISANDARITLD